MTDDQPKTFPNSVRLAMHYQEMITIRSFLEWAAAEGILLGQNCSTGSDLFFEPLGELTEATILRAFDIDLDELTAEREEMIKNVEAPTDEEPETEPCPDCKGAGRDLVPYGERCDRCSGEG